MRSQMLVSTNIGGIPVSLSMDALHALQAAIGPVADARRISTLAHRYMRDLVREAVQATVESLGAAATPSIHLGVDKEVSSRLDAIWMEQPLRIALLSRDAQSWEGWVDRLQRHADEVLLCLDDAGLAKTIANESLDIVLWQPPALGGTAPECLRRFPGPLGVLVRGDGVWSALGTIVAIAEDGLYPKAEGNAQIVRLVAMARGRKMHEMQGKLRVRWELEARHACVGNAIRSTLHFQHEERLPESKDLTAVVGWGQVPSATLADVVGHREAKAALTRHLAWLRNRNGKPGMQGVLLWGPPGTGKSLLASAVAGEAGAAYIHVRGPELHSEWLAETEKNIRTTMAMLAPPGGAGGGPPGGCGILVIDEVDALAPERRTASRSEPGWVQSVVAELLVGFDRLNQTRGRILIIGTTNHLESVDEAVRRSGRLGHHIRMGLPKLDERIELLQNQFPFAFNEDELQEAAEAAEGLSQADFAALADEVRTLVQERTGDPVPVLWGEVAERRTGRQSAQGPRVEGRARWQMAVHLAGHLLVASRVLGPDAIPPRVRLTDPLSDPKTGCLWHFENEAATAVDPLNLLAIVLAGQAAEAWALEDRAPGPGCWGDMACATRLAHTAINGGLSGREDLPYLNIGSLPESLQTQFQSPMAKAVERALLVGTARAAGIASDSSGKLLTLALRLDTAGMLSRKEIVAILEGPSIPY